MNTQLVHIIDIPQGQNKTQFQIQLPRNAIRIEGVMIGLWGTEIFTLPEMAMFIDNNAAGSINLHVVGEQNTFFAQGFNIQRKEQNLELLPAVQTFFFPDAEPWVHGKAQTFFDLSVALKVHLIEGFYQNHLPIQPGDSYRVYITLKLATT